MKLENNIVRVNGYLNGKRAHIDFEVPMVPIASHISNSILAPFYYDDEMVRKAFESKKLDTVTSINAWNFVVKHRITTRIL